MATRMRLYSWLAEKTECTRLGPEGLKAETMDLKEDNQIDQVKWNTAQIPGFCA